MDLERYPGTIAHELVLAVRHSDVYRSLTLSNQAGAYKILIKDYSRFIEKKESITKGSVDFAILLFEEWLKRSDSREKAKSIVSAATHAILQRSELPIPTQFLEFARGSGFDIATSILFGDEVDVSQCCTEAGAVYGECLEAAILADNYKLLDKLAEKMNAWDWPHYVEILLRTLTDKLYEWLEARQYEWKFDWLRDREREVINVPKLRFLLSKLEEDQLSEFRSAAITVFERDAVKHPVSREYMQLCLDFKVDLAGTYRRSHHPYGDRMTLWQFLLEKRIRIPLQGILHHHRTIVRPSVTVLRGFSSLPAPMVEEMLVSGLYSSDERTKLSILFLSYCVHFGRKISPFTEETICEAAGAAETKKKDRDSLLAIIEMGYAHQAARMKSKIAGVEKNKVSKLV